MQKKKEVIGLYVLSAIHFAACVVWIVLSGFYTGDFAPQTTGFFNLYLTSQPAYAVPVQTGLSSIQLGAICVFVFFFSALGLLFSGLDPRGGHNVRHAIAFNCMSLALLTLLTSQILGLGQVEFLIPSFFIVLICGMGLHYAQHIQGWTFVFSTVVLWVMACFPIFSQINNFAFLLTDQVNVPSNYSAIIILWFILYFMFFIFVVIDQPVTGVSTSRFTTNMTFVFAVWSTVTFPLITFYYAGLAVPNIYLDVTAGIFRFIAQTV